MSFEYLFSLMCKIQLEKSKYDDNNEHGRN